MECKAYEEVKKSPNRNEFLLNPARRPNVIDNSVSRGFTNMKQTEFGSIKMKYIFELDKFVQYFSYEINVILEHYNFQFVSFE